MNKLNRPNVNALEVRLVALAAAGERDAQRKLFEQYRDIAYRVAFRITGRPEDAMDVVQDGFIRAFERLSEFQQQSSFKTWLLRIVSNRAVDVLRARKIRLAIPLDGGDEDEPGFELADRERHRPPDDEIERQELSERLRRAVEALPPEQRAVFALSAMGEMSYGEIAATLGVPIGTVMSRLFHARRKLRALLPDLAPSITEAANT